MRTPDGADAPVREGFCGSSKSPGGAGIAAGHPPSRDQQGIPRRRAPEAAGWAKGESGELKSQLYRAIDDAYLTKIEFDELYEDTDKVSKKIANFVKYLNSSKIKGLKFKDRSDA